jgi:hypothetical protein
LKFDLLVKNPLRYFRRNNIQNHNRSQGNKEWRGQWTEFKKPSQRTERKKKRYSHDQKGCCEQIFSRSALEERSAGANDQDDHRSGDCRFEKPAGSE